jgi:hypothetical protein
MLKVLVLLVAGCAWLLAERYSLNERLENLESKIVTVERQKTDLGQKVAVKEGRVNLGVGQSTWLQERIQSSRTRLDTSDSRAACNSNSIDQTYPSGPTRAVRTSPYYTGTTVIKQGDTTINNYINPQSRPYVPALNAPAKRVESR